MKKMLCGLAATLLLFAPSVSASDASRIEALYEALKATDDDIFSKMDASYDLDRFNAAFENALATQDLASSTDADVETIFRAADFAAFRTFDMRHVARMRAALDELRRRSLAGEAHYESMTSIYVGAREMRAAAEMNRLLPEEKRIVVPNLVDKAITGARPSVLVPERAGSGWNLVRQPADLSGRRVVVLASPACGFSRRFFEEVRRNDALGRYVAQSLVVMPQVTGLLLDEVDAWNSANPAYRMSYVYTMSEWRMVDYWGTPTFYFLEDGKVKEKIVGWQPGVTLPKLLAAYRAWER